MQLDFWHSYWVKYQLVWKEIAKISAIIGRFKPPNGWTRNFIFRFAFSYYNSTRQTGRVTRTCENEMIEHFNEYELAMTEIHRYYDLPLVSYSYTEDMLLLHIAIYVKHYQEQTLELFNLQAVPVTYHPNRKPSDENHVYTW